MATPRRQENPQFLRETEPFDSYVWALTTTLLCSIFLPVLVRAIPCIGKDLGMCTVAYASLMVELQQDGCTLEVDERILLSSLTMFGHLSVCYTLIVF